MTEIEEEGVNVAIDYNQDISLIRFRGNSLAPCQMTLRAEVLPSGEFEEIDFDVAFAKIRFWFETIVSRSIAFCVKNSNAMDLLFADGRPHTLNSMMVTPFEPTDEHLAVLFQCKMAALSGGTLEFGCVRIESSDSNGLVFTYVGEWKNDLPPMTDWFRTMPYYFDSPWWTRDDASVMDYIAADADPKTPPTWAFKLDFIEKSMRPMADGPVENVVRGAFTPKIIDGGRHD